MRLTFTYIIKPNKSQEKIIKELMWHSSKVYNMLNYDVKEGKEKINANGILNVEGSKIYKKYRKENWHSEYLHSHMLQQIILNYIRDYKSYIAIKSMYEKGEKEIKGKYKIEIIYEKEEKKQAKGSNIMAIDLGMNNLTTCTNMKNNKSLIIAGESLKSKIGYINKEIARLEGIQMKMIGSKKYKNTKRINKLYEQRRNYSKTYMHKASRQIIEYAQENVVLR